MPFSDSQLNNHTYPLRFEYHKCPHCGKLFESRKGYLKRDDLVWKKFEKCPTCKESVTIEKKMPPVLGA